jgi:GntR family transcriptional regulator
MLDRNCGIPLHAQLAHLLRERILDAELRPHAQLTSERALCERYGVSRITVRKALSDLLHEGLIYTTVGKGTFVADSHLDEELQPLSSFSQDIERRGMSVSSRLLDAGVFNADDHIASRLQIPRGAEVVQIDRLRLADDLPIAIQFSLLSHHLCPGLLDYDLTARSLFDVLRTDYGLQLTRADTVIEAALATPEESRLLELATPAAVLVSEQVTRLSTEAIIEITRSVFRGDRYKLHTHC